MNIAIVGASGMVGQMFLKILDERNFPVDELFLFASARSAGRTVEFRGKEYIIQELDFDVFDKSIQSIDFALFGVSGELSKKYAPIAAKAGCIVVDNSSAWRMDEKVPLIVPEVNPEDIIIEEKGIIANPNCCAVPTVIALKPLRDAFGLKRVVLSTYQSVSGAGVAGLDDLGKGFQGSPPSHFPHPIAFNVIPHIDKFHDDGYTGEEKKLMNEVRKILHLPELPITATCVRVPVKVGHSISVSVTLGKDFELEVVRKLLASSPGAILADDPANNIYPMPIAVAGTNNVLIGRIRRDNSHPNSLNMWISADNTRKGAALNAVQILEMEELQCRKKM